MDPESRRPESSNLLAVPQICASFTELSIQQLYGAAEVPKARILKMLFAYSFGADWDFISDWSPGAVQFCRLALLQSVEDYISIEGCEVQGRALNLMTMMISLDTIS
jgi:hypothetical protein